MKITLTLLRTLLNTICISIVLEGLHIHTRMRLTHTRKYDTTPSTDS